MSIQETVQLTSGLIKGSADGKLIQFRGVPYAEPPVGDLRFATPKVVKPWAGVREAVHNGPITPQIASRAFDTMGPISEPQGEDCLSVNVWVPRDAAVPLPVVVWLHGGGFGSGSASIPWYDGGRLAREQGVIVVGLNYRVATLGFLSIPGVVPGNLGVLDQIAGIQWVKREIASFGGNPEAITLMGQSAGAYSIASLLAAPETQGLFQRAILQSPPIGLNTASAADAARYADAFLQQLGLSRDDTDLIGRLRELSVEQILAAQGVAAGQLGRLPQGDLRPPYMPLDGEAPYALHGQPLSEAAGRAAAERGVDLLMGSTRDEANLFFSGFPQIVHITEEDMQAAVRGIGSSAEIAEYLPPADTGLTPGQRFMAFVGRRAFSGPVAHMAQAATARNGKAFVYQFDWASPLPGLGACHCVELLFTFGNLDSWPGAAMYEGAARPEIEALSAEVMNRWGAFIRTGDPGFAAWSTLGEPVFHFDRLSVLETA